MCHSTRLAAKDTTNLGFANPKAFSKGAVRRLVCQGSNPCHLFVRQLDVRRVFTFLVVASALYGTVLSGLSVVVTESSNKGFPAASTYDGLLPALPGRGSAISGPVLSRMGLPGYQGQVFDLIVGSVMIQVVDKFVGEQRTPEMHCHYKAMLQDVTSGPGIRMLWTENEDVSLIGSDFPSVPVNVPVSLVLVPLQIASIVATFDTPLRSRGDWPKFFSASASTFHRYPPLCWSKHRHYNTPETFVQGVLSCKS